RAGHRRSLRRACRLDGRGLPRHARRRRRRPVRRLILPSPRSFAAANRPRMWPRPQPAATEQGMPDVVSLGIHILDVLGRPVNRIPPRQDVDLIEEIRLTVAGTAAGTSVDLAKLGASVLAMGAIGEDAAGNFIVDTMNRFGIDTSGLVRK